MAQQQYEHVKYLLEEVLKPDLSTDAFSWLQKNAHSAAQFNLTFVSIPRKTGRKPVQVSAETKNKLHTARPGFYITGWSIDRLTRVWLLLTVDHADKQEYFNRIERLFQAAEVNELVALYSALPVLEYPDMWVARCSEGIRSNIGDVLHAIMCNNPYPSENLNEAAWNQLVLKAFFTEKPIHEIIGLDSRTNLRLAMTLSDYAHERWAAHRNVHPQLWRCVGKFIDRQLFPDIKKLWDSNNIIEREAAALACSDSGYAPAKELLNSDERMQAAISSGELTWNTLAEKTADYVLQ